MKSVNSATIHLRFLTLYTDRLFKASGADLRRAVTARFSDIPVLHNHHGKGFDYRSPRVRYIVVDGIPRLVSFDDGLEIVEQIYAEGPDLLCGSSLYRVSGTELEDRYEIAGISGELHHYRSFSPWMALNEENVTRYFKAGNSYDRRALLERIMAANMLAFSKNVSLDIQDRIMVKLLGVRETRVRAGDTPMVGFRVNFVTNFRIPTYVGIGKMVSKGFGVMMQEL